MNDLATMAMVEAELARLVELARWAGFAFGCERLGEETPSQPDLFDAAPDMWFALEPDEFPRRA